jgi:hypothetical protein
VNQQGYVAFGYSASSPTLYVGAYGSLLSGTTELPFTIQGGLDYYIRTSGNGRNLWGQTHSASISVDPVDDSFWIFNQFADIRGSVDTANGDDGRWGTVWARVYCTAPVCVTCCSFFLVSLQMMDSNSCSVFYIFSCCDSLYSLLHQLLHRQRSQQSHLPKYRQWPQ